MRAQETGLWVPVCVLPLSCLVAAAVAVASVLAVERGRETSTYDSV